MGLFENESALVQVMAWRRTGVKPLPEPMLTQFTDAYKRHSGEMSFKPSAVYTMLWWPSIPLIHIIHCFYDPTTDVYFIYAVIDRGIF